MEIPIHLREAVRKGESQLRTQRREEFFENKRKEELHKIKEEMIKTQLELESLYYQKKKNEKDLFDLKKCLRKVEIRKSNKFIQKHLIPKLNGALRNIDTNERIELRRQEKLKEQKLPNFRNWMKTKQIRKQERINSYYSALKKVNEK